MTAKDQMNPMDDPQLVQLIAREVLAQLQARAGGQPGAPSGTQADAPSGVSSASAAPQRAGADVRPPIGTCTGDYTKFPELADRLNPPVVRSAVRASEPAAPQAAALTGIVTENQLREAVAASTAGVALLSPTARLTPLANDFARQFPGKIQRVTQESAGSSSTSGAAAAQGGDLPWLWWIQGQCPVVQEVVTGRASRLRTITAPRAGEHLSRVVRELAEAVKMGRAAGGLLFVPTAARAACLANRCESLRAIVATSGQAVEEGVRELGANVLVVEYPHHGPRAVMAMVDRLIGQPPVIPAGVSRDLADLHRCG